MRKIGLGLILLIATSAFAGRTFGAALEDLVDIKFRYDEEHSEYILARSQLQQAGTLVARTKAQKETKEWLEARDEVVTAHLRAVNEKLDSAVGINESIRAGLEQRISLEISWFDEHRSTLASAGSLQDLEASSAEARGHFFSVTEPLVFETLGAVSIGVSTDFRTRLTDILGSSKTKTAEIRANGDHNTATIERWTVEVENKITRSLDSELEAQSLTLSLNSAKTKNKKEVYDSVVERSEDSLLLLREASAFLREIVTAMKVSDR